VPEVSAKRHWEDRLIVPESFDCEPFPVPLKPGPGKAWVAMCKTPDEVGEGFNWQGKDMKLILPSGAWSDDEYGVRQGDITAKYYMPDFGRLVRFEPKLNSKGEVPAFYRSLRAGMIVAVKPFTGMWLTNADFPWIPQGRILKLVGTVNDLSDDILAYVEQDEEAA